MAKIDKSIIVPDSGLAARPNRRETGGDGGNGTEYGAVGGHARNDDMRDLPYPLPTVPSVTVP